MLGSMLAGVRGAPGSLTSLESNRRASTVAGRGTAAVPGDLDAMASLMTCFMRPRFSVAERSGGCELIQGRGALTAEMAAASHVTLDFSACAAQLAALSNVERTSNGVPSEEELRHQRWTLRPDSFDALEVAEVRASPHHRPLQHRDDRPDVQVPASQLVTVMVTGAAASPLHSLAAP